MTTTIQIQLPMPRLGETMDEGTIANWLVKPGAAFKRGDALLELETDKTLVEYPALGSGTLIETLVGPGDIVPVGAPIAVIETEDAWDAIDGAANEEPHAQPEPTKTPAPTQRSTAHAATTGNAISSQAGKLRATPLARRIARHQGLDVASVKGTGRRGRVEACDVQALVGAVSRPSPRSLGGRSTVYPFLFVHGFAGAATNWTALRASLQRANVASVAPDLPGHGRNNSEARTVDVMVDWLVDEIATASEPVHLVGHSLGAHISVRAMLRAPEKVARMTLIAPAGCGHEINGTFIHGMANAKSPGELAHLMRLLGPKAAALGDDALAAMADDLGGGRLAALADDMARGDAQQIDTLGPLREVATNIPVQAIFGIADVIVPKEHVFNMPPQVACHLVRGGHMPHWDSPGLVERVISRAM